MRNIFKRIFGSSGFEKQPLPQEYQLKIIFNQFSKEDLTNLPEKYILTSNHLNLIGSAFRNMNELGLAEKAYKDAIESAPENDEPYGNLMSLYILQGKYELCEDIYQQGMHNATKKSFIIFQDGRLAYIQDEFQHSLMAARCVLTDENFASEEAFILCIRSLLSLIKEEDNVEKNTIEAIEMWQLGISVFPESDELKKLGEYFQA